MRYYIDDDGGGPDDASEVPEECLRHVRGGDPSEFAEAAAQHEWDRHDGWERSWPVTMTVILDDGSEQKFDVDMEAVPTFHAYKTKENENAVR